MPHPTTLTPVPTTLSPADCHIDTDLIPESAQLDLYRVLMPAIREYYKDPEHERRFREWQREYRKRKNDR